MLFKPINGDFGICGTEIVKIATLVKRKVVIKCFQVKVFNQCRVNFLSTS